MLAEDKKLKREEYTDFNYDECVQSIMVTSPASRSDINGDTKIDFAVPGMKYIKALCWRQPTAENPSQWATI